MPWRVKVGKKTLGCARKKTGAKRLAKGHKRARMYKVKSCAK